MTPDLPEFGSCGFMPISRQELFDFFDAHGIAHRTIDHPPVFTVKESQSVKINLSGAHTKNLFLKDKSAAHFLICAEMQTSIRLNRLHPVIGCKRLSFGKPDKMLELLGVLPGSVTLFSVINDTSGDVRLIIDRKLVDARSVNFHPLSNDATTAISSADMLKFAGAAGHDPIILDFTAIG